MPESEAPADVLVVLCTAPDEATATKLARGLVEARIAACVSALPGARSFYRWESAIEEDCEVQLLIKTCANRWHELVGWIDEHHPYDIPELLALPVGRGSHAYLSWLRDAANPVSNE